MDVRAGSDPFADGLGRVGVPGPGVERGQEVAPDAGPRTVIRFAVSVPVLSEQIVVAEPMVSQALRALTRLLSAIIFDEEKARDRVTASGRPSGTATARIVIDWTA